MALFTIESSRLAAQRSVEVRRARAVERANAPIPEPTPIAPVPPIAPDSFTAARLARIRAQLEMIDSLIESERIPQNLDRLAAASAKLSELERVLSDRPLPGSRRPSNPRRSRVGSVDAQPE